MFKVFKEVNTEDCKYGVYNVKCKQCDNNIPKNMKDENGDTHECSDASKVISRFLKEIVTAQSSNEHITTGGNFP